MIPRLYSGWVAPFGYPRINSRSQIPVAFRCLPRPSSPPDARASTIRPSCLDPYLPFCCQRTKKIYKTKSRSRHFFLRKEVIQPQVPLRLPCYDFTPITGHTLGTCLLAVSAVTSGTTGFRGVTGGVYKARERIHRGVLIHDY